jgi:hypothetical protein
VVGQVAVVDADKIAAFTTAPKTLPAGGSFRETLLTNIVIESDRGTHGAAASPRPRVISPQTADDGRIKA